MARLIQIYVNEKHLHLFIYFTNNAAHFLNLHSLLFASGASSNKIKNFKNAVFCLLTVVLQEQAAGQQQQQQLIIIQQQQQQAAAEAEARRLEEEKRRVEVKKLAEKKVEVKKEVVNKEQVIKKGVVKVIKAAPAKKKVQESSLSASSAFSSSSRSLSELHALRLRLEAAEGTLSQHVHICFGDDGGHDCGLKITQLEVGTVVIKQIDSQYLFPIIQCNTCICVYVFL